MIDRYLLPDGATFPEGITEAPDGESFFVSASRDGAILRGRLDEPELRQWLPAGEDGRTAALGMATTEDLLLICGADTGTFYGYALSDRRLVARHRVPHSTSLLNDVCVNDGYAYVTDSLRPVIWRFPLSDGLGTAEEWLDLTTLGAAPDALHYLNGIVATAGGTLLLVAAQGTGVLWRVDIAARTAGPVELPGIIVNGDGMVFVDDVLYVCDNTDEPDGGVRYWLTGLRLSADAWKAELAGRWEYPASDTPTTIAYLGGRLLLVNSQFGADRLGTAKPPFTVGVIPPPV